MIRHFNLYQSGDLMNDLAVCPCVKETVLAVTVTLPILKTLFQVIRNRLGPNPNYNPNTLQNRKEAFHHLLDYCLDRNLKLEHWDVHFCQGSSKQLKTNERTKAQTYANAWEDFCRQEENEDALRSSQRISDRDWCLDLVGYG